MSLKRFLLAVLLAAGCSLPVLAQEVSLRASSAYMVDRKHVGKITPSRSYPSLDLKLGWQIPRDGEFSSHFGNPTGGIGLSWTMPGTMVFPDANGKMGDGLCLYGFFNRPFVRRGIFSMGYTLELGGSWLTNPYDKTSNPLNECYGGSLEYYLGGALYALFDIGNHWSVGAEAGMRHHSSGSWYVPNWGLSSFMLGLDFKYTVSDWFSDISDKVPERGIPDKAFRWGVFAGAGGHRSEGERLVDVRLHPDRPAEGRIWLKGSAGLECFWRYSRFFATGIGSEFFYFSNADAQREVDKVIYYDDSQRYSKFAAGLLLLQEVYYGRFAVHGGIGLYLSRHMGIDEKEGPLYEKLGMRYYTRLVDGAFAGFAIRLHSFTQSDYMELTIGKHF